MPPHCDSMDGPAVKAATENQYIVGRMSYIGKNPKHER